MAYHTSNAAYAYDMQAQPLGFEQRAPRVAERPQLDVVTGAGREANQAVSPVFMHAIKVIGAVLLLFCIVGLARVSIASVTAAQLNAAASLSSELETIQDESADLEVMRSVYGSNTRIRDLATGTLGMVESTDSTVIDVSDAAQAAAAAGTQAAAE